MSRGTGSEMLQGARSVIGTVIHNVQCIKLKRTVSLKLRIKLQPEWKSVAHYRECHPNATLVFRHMPQAACKGMSAHSLFSPSHRPHTSFYSYSVGRRKLPVAFFLSGFFGSGVFSLLMAVMT